MSLIYLYLVSKIPVIKGVFIIVGVIGEILAAIAYIGYVEDKDTYPRLRAANDFAFDVKCKMSYIMNELKVKKSPNYEAIEENTSFICKNIDHFVNAVYDQLDEHHKYGKHIMFWLVLFSLIITIGILLPDKELIEQAMEMYK